MKERGNGRVVSDDMGESIYKIPYRNIGYNIGYANFGEEMNYVTIVVEYGTSIVWTTFPFF